MEWTEALRRAVDYLEEHLLEKNVTEGAAEAARLSAFYLQRGFKLITGFTMGEYVRCRRLYLAGLEVIAGREKVIDLAYRYGFETPESFAKAFRRFHGLSPAHLRRRPERLRPFLPLKITISITGGDDMDCTVEKMESLRLIGVEREIRGETAYEDIPRFWDEFAARWSGLWGETDLARCVRECAVGEFGVCLDEEACESFRYLIAGRYDGRPVPEGLTVVEFPAMEWAKFRCSGPLPGALQTVNTQIFRQWLPGNPLYELGFGGNIEWYSRAGQPTDLDYESAIWVPVKRR